MSGMRAECLALRLFLVDAARADPATVSMAACGGR